MGWVFAVFAALLLIALLSGAVGWVFDTLPGEGGRMDWGNVAEWVAGLGTILVAFLAWRTSRDAASTAHAAFLEQQREEASLVTVWLERGARETITLNEGIVDLPSSNPVLLPWEQTYPEDTDASGGAVLRIANGNETVIGHVSVSIPTDNHNIDPFSRGIRDLGMLRPGASRYWVHLLNVGSTPAGEHKMSERIHNNEFIEWIQFTDTKGLVWRRHGDGALERIEDPAT